MIGIPEQLKWMQERLGEKYQLTVEALGPGKQHVKEVRMLNRIIRWTKEGLEYEADPRHVEIMIDQLDLKNAKPAVTPGSKEEGTA